MVPSGDVHRKDVHRKDEEEGHDVVVAAVEIEDVLAAAAVAVAVAA